MWIRYDVLKIIALLLITAGLLGCPPGGSSGNNGGNQNTTDTTPPIISSTVPVNNATDVAVNTRIVAIFNEPPDTSTISTSTFLVSDGSGTIAGSVLCSFKTATFTPSANLATGATYTVTITTAVRDLTGNPLAFDRVWHFTTGNLKAWSQPELLDNLTARAGAPAVAADRLNNGSGDGTVTVAWVQSDGDQESIFASRYNGTWSTPVTIETQSTGGFSGGAYGPRVAMNQYGQAVVAWGYSEGPGNYRIWSNEYNGGWGTERHISSTSGNANSHQVAFDANGEDIIALWSQYQSGNNQSNYYILQRQHHHVSCLNNPACGISDPNVIGWQAMSVFAPPYDIGDASEPQIAAWGNRNAVAVWTQNTSAGNQIWANIATSGTWSVPVRINTGSVSSANTPVVAADGNGFAVAAWFEFVSGRPRFYASGFNGSAWSAPVTIDDPNAGQAVYRSNYPSMIRAAMDSSGNALFVWLQENTNRTMQNVHARSCIGGSPSNCDAPVLLETSNGWPAFPDLAIALNGDAIAVWKQEDGSARRIYANHYTAATNSWNANPTRVGGANGTWSEGPQIAIDGSGRATVVWTEFENSEYNIYAVRYE